LRVEFRDFENGQYFSGFHVIANIDVDLTNVAGDLGVDVDFLIWQKFAGNLQSVRDGPAPHPRDGRARRVPHGRGGHGAAGVHSPCNERANQNAKRHSSQNGKHILTHLHSSSSFHQLCERAALDCHSRVPDPQTSLQRHYSTKNERDKGMRA